MHVHIQFKDVLNNHVERKRLFFVLSAEDSNAKMFSVEALTAPTDPRLRSLSVAYKHFRIKSLPAIIHLEDASKQATELYEFFVRPDDLKGKRDKFLNTIGMASDSKQKKSNKKKDKRQKSETKQM